MLGVSVTFPRHEVIQVGELTIELPDGLVRMSGRVVKLSIKEFELLVALARAVGRIVSREQLYLDVWGKPLNKRDRSVDVYVHKLRAKLDAAQPDRSLIHTHPGFGYRLSPEPSQDLHN